MRKLVSGSHFSKDEIIMTEDSVVDFVAGELAKYRLHDAIIVDVCERYGFKWDEAATLVHDVENHHQNRIASKRFPIILTLSFMMIAVGTLLAASSLYSYIVGDSVVLGVTTTFFGVESPIVGQLQFFTVGLLLLIGGVAGLVLNRIRSRTQNYRGIPFIRDNCARLRMQISRYYI